MARERQIWCLQPDTFSTWSYQHDTEDDKLRRHVSVIVSELYLKHTNWRWFCLSPRYHRNTKLWNSS